MEIKFKPTDLFLEQNVLNKKENCPNGFYENLYNVDKYSSLEEAIEHKDYVTVSTGQNEETLLGYHLHYHLNNTEKFIIFSNQDPRFGEDAMDNGKMLNEVDNMLR